MSPDVVEIAPQRRGSCSQRMSLGAVLQSRSVDIDVRACPPIGAHRGRRKSQPSLAMPCPDTRASPADRLRPCRRPPTRIGPIFPAVGQSPISLSAGRGPIVNRPSARVDAPSAKVLRSTPRPSSTAASCCATIPPPMSCARVHRDGPQPATTMCGPPSVLNPASSGRRPRPIIARAMPRFRAQPETLRASTCVGRVSVGCG